MAASPDSSVFSTRLFRPGFRFTKLVLVVRNQVFRQHQNLRLILFNWNQPSMAQW